MTTRISILRCAFLRQSTVAPAAYGIAFLLLLFDTGTEAAFLRRDMALGETH